MTTFLIFGRGATNLISRARRGPGRGCQSAPDRRVPSIIRRCRRSVRGPDTRDDRPNVVCGGRTGGPRRRCHGDGDRSKGRRSDDDHRAGPGGDHPRGAAAMAWDCSATR